ncbi:MAG: acetoacetate--CoA ligase [Sulfuricaulis sp.]
MNECPSWQPSAASIDGANMTAFMREVNTRWGINLSDYGALHRWSVEQPERFWISLWDFCKVISIQRGERVLVDGDKMPGAVWFPEARLNFAQNLLRRRDESDALVFWDENGLRRRLSHGELYRAVAQFAAALRSQDVRPGDRVAAIMPNMPETIVAMLAAASIGAVFSSTSPDFGVQGVLDRFSQIAPKLLLAADGYSYRGKRFDCLEKLGEIAHRLTSVQHTVIVPCLDAQPDPRGIRAAQTYADFVAPHAGETEIRFDALPFGHPLSIIYTSGTTGAPKCIVHGAGGVLLQHLKEHRLHSDVKPGDRMFYFTTCGWMMWNWLVSGLASGATLLLYDGSPFIPGRGTLLFDYAEAEGITHFGTSASFIHSFAKLGLEPVTTHRLDKLRVMLSTGSPLAPEGFDYVYRNIKRDLCLSSISGGSDILSCFVLGNPAILVWRGEIQCRGLGMAVEVFNEDGKPVRGGKGDLVCTAPFPSMPLGFWNDADGAKYRAAYFEKYPGVWSHGDYAELTAHDGAIIHGRSDAVLNPGGVRIGTAEIYREVMKLPEVTEALAIDQHWPPGQRSEVRVVLFVCLRDNLILDQALIATIKQSIRRNATPRHVPAKVLQVPDMPRTRSGKLVELAVRNVVHGEPVKNADALANPEALEYFRHRAELQN